MSDRMAVDGAGEEVGDIRVEDKVYSDVSFIYWR